MPRIFRDSSSLSHGYLHLWHHPYRTLIDTTVLAQQLNNSPTPLHRNENCKRTGVFYNPDFIRTKHLLGNNKTSQRLSCTPSSIPNDVSIPQLNPEGIRFVDPGVHTCYYMTREISPSTRYIAFSGEQESGEIPIASLCFGLLDGFLSA